MEKGLPAVLRKLPGGAARVVRGVLAALALSGSAAAQSADFGLFVPVDPAGRPGLPALSSLPSAVRGGDLTVRARRVVLDRAAFAALESALAIGGAPTVVRLNLFPDVAAVSPVRWSDVTADGFSWGGGVVGDPSGSVAVAVNAGAVRGVVRLGGVEFRIAAGADLITISEIARPPGGDVVDTAVPPPGGAFAGPPAAGAFADPGSRVDLAVFYSRRAMNREDGPAGIHALIDAWVADLNTAYARSGVFHTVHLVYRGLAPYTAGDADAWFCGTAPEYGGCFETAVGYGADLIHTIITAGDFDVSAGPPSSRPCGKAFLPGGVGVTQLSCGSLVFAHELAHNHGVHHDRYQVLDECTEDPECTSPWSPPGTSGYSVYGFAYVNQAGLRAGGPRSFRTITSYGDQCQSAGVRCDALMRFSNPGQLWLGDPMGVPGDVEPGGYSTPERAARLGPANAVRAHNVMAETLANHTVRTAPDLAVLGVRFEDPDIPEGGVARLSAVVRNLGTRLESGGYSASAQFRAVGSVGRWTVAGDSSPLRAPIERDRRFEVVVPFILPAGSGSREFRVCARAEPGRDTDAVSMNNCSEAIPLAARFDPEDPGIAVKVTAVPRHGAPGTVFRLGAEIRNDLGEAFPYGGRVEVVEEYAPAGGGAASTRRLPNGFADRYSPSPACPRLNPAEVCRLAADWRMPQMPGRYTYTVTATDGSQGGSEGSGSASIGVSGAPAFPLELELVSFPSEVVAGTRLELNLFVRNPDSVDFDQPSRLDVWVFRRTVARSRTFRVDSVGAFGVHRREYTEHPFAPRDLTGIAVCLYPESLVPVPDPRVSSNRCEHRSVRVLDD